MDHLYKTGWTLFQNQTNILINRNIKSSNNIHKQSRCLPVAIIYQDTMLSHLIRFKIINPMVSDNPRTYSMNRFWKINRPSNQMLMWLKQFKCLLATYLRNKGPALIHHKTLSWPAGLQWRSPCPFCQPSELLLGCNKFMRKLPRSHSRLMNLDYRRIMY